MARNEILSQRAVTPKPTNQKLVYENSFQQRTRVVTFLKVAVPCNVGGGAMVLG